MCVARPVLTFANCLLRNVLCRMVGVRLLTEMREDLEAAARDRDLQQQQRVRLRALLAVYGG